MAIYSSTKETQNPLQTQSTSTSEQTRIFKQLSKHQSHWLYQVFPVSCLQYTSIIYPAICTIFTNVFKSYFFYLLNTSNAQTENELNLPLDGARRIVLGGWGDVACGT